MQPPSFSSPNASGGPSPAPSLVLPNGFTLHQIADRQHGNVVASAFAFPAAWQARSEMVWNFQDMALPVKARAQTYNPQGAECLEFLPNEMFVWLPEGMGYYRPGQNSMGLTFMQPMSCVDALRMWVLPKFRGNLPGLRITRAGTTPILSRLGPRARQVQGEEACLAVEYILNGRTLEEEIYGVKVQQNIPYYGPQGMMTQVNWGFPYLFSFRAEKGQLDANRPLFWQIAASLQLNPVWERLFGQIQQQLQMQFDQYIQMGYSQIQAAGQLSRAISANNDAMLSQFAHQRQAAHISQARHQTGSGRTTHDDFSDMMRGVETVEDPYWGESQQDNNYLYHWTDGQGNYQHSDDPFFNPSIGATQDWTLMEPVRRS